MSEWEFQPLGHLTVLLKDGTHGSYSDCEDGIPLLSAKDIEKGKVQVPDDCRKISLESYKSIHSTYELEEFDILLTIVGTIGRSAVFNKINHKITFQRSVAIIRIDRNRLYPIYGYHYINSFEFQQHLESFKNASAQGGVYLGALNKIPLFFPTSLAEQRKIARILSTVDVVIEKTEAAIAKYKAIKAGMMRDLFTRGIDRATGKLRPSYEEAPQLYKQTELGWMPKEWDVPQIDNIAVHVGSGIAPTGGSNVYKNEGVLFIRSQNVHFHGLHLDDVAFIEKDMHNMMERSKVRPFDVLLNITGASIGRVCYFPESLIEANVNQHVCIIRVSNPTKSKSLYLSTFLSSTFGQNQIDRLNAGGNREGLNYQQLRAFYIPWPEQDIEIEKAANSFISINRKIDTEIYYCEKTKLLKQALMSDLLTGRIRVKYEEEKAEVM